MLVSLILVSLLTVRPKIKNLFFLFIGILIPLLPFLYFDIRFHCFETRRIIDFLTIAQYRVYVPNRWLTYGGIYWPTTWASIIGGETFVAYGIIVLLVLFSFLNLNDLKKEKNYYFIALSFAISVFLFRYYRGERLFYYANFSHAFVLLVTTWTLFQAFKFKKILGILTLLLVTIFSLKANSTNLKPRIITYGQVSTMVREIYQKYPGSYFAIYECPFSGSMISMPVAYKMYYDGRISLDGIKIGVCNEGFKLSWREVGNQEIDKPYMYQNKSTPRVYQETTEWWVTHPPGEQLYE